MAITSVQTKQLKYLKWALVAVTPTISALHVKWIAHLLELEWSAFTKAMGAFVVAISFAAAFIRAAEID